MNDYRALLHDLLADLDRLLHADPPSDPEGDVYELASHLHEVAVTEDVRARLLERRRAIEAAIRRVDEGSFGTCSICRGRIAARRLAVCPEAELCVRCQEAVEEAGG